MSGGYFEYKQHYINDIIDKLEKFLEDQKNKEREEVDDFYVYPDNIIVHAMYTLNLLKLSQVFLNRLDYLFSYDESEDSYIENLKKDMKNEAYKLNSELKFLENIMQI